MHKLPEQRIFSLKDAICHRATESIQKGIEEWGARLGVKFAEEKAKLLTWVMRGLRLPFSHRDSIKGL